mmetsp:Transcript_7281/g.10655  ORF Transcript_7281/g.10655 Transcript_7281/m.10655 type:complete len:280 (-) Transcript_7281:278-1117(-)|eukprot:CAMPEP_0194217172 /NCGR_PEP_ID=MMETSP0156-20130528/20525_1 /TAXON_ID=33649 /ORGANISM="Thalassionema nitzschioides, Strain L26-B" /LENGTH=279 /DNA_ID=CAMNT_0038946141 /DNA_START=70 /DNA_END=909 /DNA_ORIENTATION=-
MVYKASLIVSPSKSELPFHLNQEILKISREAIEARGAFTIALSGGSLPSFLQSLPSNAPNEEFGKWHVLLADERCVPLTDPDSNLGTLQEKLLTNINIPTSQVHGINQSKLKDIDETTSDEIVSWVAQDYEDIVKTVLNEHSGGRLDLAVLGFGPDGHTCSLFPDHKLLKEDTKWVAGIIDSPKPPPERVTVTFPVLNEITRHVIFCGAGGSKAPILKEIFQSVSKSDTSANLYQVIIKEPYPYPCAGVLPKSEGGGNSLTYCVDQDAMEGVVSSKASL